MKKNILLIEPPYPASNLPFGLQKIATYHLNRGDNVKFIHDEPYKAFSSKAFFHKIYITSVFTFHGRVTVQTINYIKRRFPDTKIMVGGIFATLMPDYIKKKTGIKPWVGVYPKVESQKPNYFLFPKTQQSTVMTSRGCPRKCEFCAVKRLEPAFSIVESWKDQIIAGHEAGLRNISIVDNNFTALPWSHQKEAINFIADNFNDSRIFFASLDARIFKDRNAKLFQRANISYIFWAFDNMGEDGYFQKTMEICYKYKIARNYHCYVLYNFEDTPEDLWYRLNEVIKSGATALPMRYAPLDSLSKSSHVGLHWTKEMLRGFQQLLRRCTPMGSSVSPSSYKHNRIGRSAKEFVDLITKENVSTSYYKKLQQSKRGRSTSLGLIPDKKKIKQGKVKKRKKINKRKKLEYRNIVFSGQAKNK